MTGLGKDVMADTAISTRTLVPKRPRFLGPLLLVVAALFPRSASSADDSVTCFNNSGLGGTLGVFVYEGHSTVESGRQGSEGKFVFGFDPGKSAYSVASLTVCGYQTAAPEQAWFPCASGTLSITEHVPGQLLAGRYAFELVDGSRKAGEFSAAFCAPRRESTREHAE